MVISIEPPFGNPAEIPPQSLRQPPRPIRHAVVIGAGIGGLLAANTLAKHAATVTILERDALPRSIEPRKGVPQGQHVHALLARGLRAVEDAVPGFIEDLQSHGAELGDASNRATWFQSGSQHARTTVGTTAVVATRSLFEGVLRQRIAALPNVTIRDRTAVRDLCWNADRTRVTGVRIAERADDSFMLCHEPADLVIDASGRGTQLAAWLTEAGYPAIPTTMIPVGVRYTSRTFARATQAAPEQIAVICVAGPESPRGGIAFAVEGNRWHVTMIGRGDDNPPTDLAEFTAFASSLPLPDIARIITSSTPLDDGVRYHTPASTRHHFERVHHFPEGILPFADSLCAFTPVYGQGMTVAALEAEVLDTCLAGGTTDMLARFMTGALPIIDNAWQLACGGDLPMLMPANQLPRKVRLLSRYLHRLHQAARTDATVAAAFANVVHLNAPVTSLMAPEIIVRVVTARFRGTRQTSGGAVQGQERALGSVSPQAR